MTTRVLMLGWEYPPHISGGLGTACEGLSRALSSAGAEVLFVVPHLVGGESAEHMTLVDTGGKDASAIVGDFFIAEGQGRWRLTQPRSTVGSVRTHRVPAALKPYWGAHDYEEYVQGMATRAADLAAGFVELAAPEETPAPGAHYGASIFEEVERYAVSVVSRFSTEQFDLIHAHDWMTFPAAVLLGRATGKPVILHVHSLEYDRSGSQVNEHIAGIERWGLTEASAVIAVSHYTRAVIAQQYGVSAQKISVVHNGVYRRELVSQYREETGKERKIVLFLGRVTFQKGPDYFVEAAARVIQQVPQALFILAGSGDMLERMMHRVRELGIESSFYFPGFLRGPEVERMFSIADLYVMPSVSEPFGIAALEALSFDTPVLISKQSGVSEVLRHALKVDFWDVERMADLITNALQYEELRADMVMMAREEIKRVRWEASAQKTLDVYRAVVSGELLHSEDSRG